MVFEERGVPGLRLWCQYSLAEVIHTLFFGYLLYRKRGRKVVLWWGDRGGGRANLGIFGVLNVGSA